MTAPDTTVELYWAAPAGHTPTRCTAASALTASVQVENEFRSGMATGGSPAETVTSMTDPSLAVTGWPGREAFGCWE